MESSNKLVSEPTPGTQISEMTSVDLETLKQVPQQLIRQETPEAVRSLLQRETTEVICQESTPILSRVQQIESTLQASDLKNTTIGAKHIGIFQDRKETSCKQKLVERTVHPDCTDAADPYHECDDNCFRRIAEAKYQDERADADLQGDGAASDEDDVPLEQTLNAKEQADGSENQKDSDNGYLHLNERQKKLFELRLKMNEARKANQMAMVAEKNKLEAPPESRGISKQKWLEERKKKIGKLLDANGLDMKKAYMLDTQEMAESKYKKWEKDPAPFGWEVFNQKTLYNAYKKRTKNIEVDMEAYNKAKEEDPEFYRNATSLQYGKAPKVPQENIDRMIKELQDREAKRKSFSRRRKFHEEKDIDSINDRNEHFNKKIERAFGKYTLEIKNNLERGTALPD